MECGSNIIQGYGISLMKQKVRTFISDQYTLTSLKEFQ